MLHYDATPIRLVSDLVTMMNRREEAKLRTKGRKKGCRGANAKAGFTAVKFSPKAWFTTAMVHGNAVGMTEVGGREIGGCWLRAKQ